MREIKFRCWDKWIKRMHTTLSIDFRATCSSERGNIVLMQYTGLKDKNGIEIYEGDIAKESRKRVKNERHFVVVWNNDIGSYTFKPLDKIETSYPCFNIGTIKNLEVVGNIYENPELIKGEE